MMHAKEDQKTNGAKKRLALPFVISLALHFTFTAVLMLNPSFAPKPPQPNDLAEVELIDADKLLEAMKTRKDQIDGQIVEQNEEALNNEIPEDAKFLSKHNQKVVRETQATEHGKFKNAQQAEGPSPQARREQAKVEKAPNEAAASPPPETLADETSDIESADRPEKLRPKTAGKQPQMRDLMPSFKPMPPPTEAQEASSGGGGKSASDDHIKNVATGMQTLLSTREFVYYSYYNRIKDKLRQYWEPMIKQKMERIVRQGRTIASESDRITKIVIILDKSGTLVRVQIVGHSGVSDLDDAAVEAFRAAAPFPNPPKGIVESDGTIKIRWDFILEASNNFNGVFRMARFRD